MVRKCTKCGKFLSEAEIKASEKVGFDWCIRCAMKRAEKAKERSWLSKAWNWLVKSLRLKSDASDRVEEAIELIYDYGGIDGAHHKQWVLDQIVRILSDDYDGWVRGYEDGEDGPSTYGWEEGIAP